MNFKLFILENLLLLFIFCLFFLRLSKKIKKLQEDKNDLFRKIKKLQEDNNDLFRKIKGLPEENAALLKKIKEIQNENIILKEELGEANTYLSNLKEEVINLRDENEKLNSLLDTISSLLNGKKTEKLRDIEKINQIEDFLLRKFIKKIDDLNIIPDEYFRFDSLRVGFDQWKMTRIREWDNGKINIALIGKFSSGKSSIINSLVGSKLLPVDTNPTTSIPTFVSHGYDDVVYYEDKEGVVREIDINTFKNISYVTLKNFPISFFIRYFVLFSDLSSVRDINILDTPGFSSGNELDRNRMIESIKYVDVIFYVVDINDGTLSMDIMKTLLEVQEIKNKPLYIIINKSDTKPPSEREKVKDHFKKILEGNKIHYRDILLYSSKKDIDNCYENLKNIINQIKKAKQELNVFDEMINLCEEVINKLKSKIHLKLSDKEAKKIEDQITLLNELLDQTKIFRREVLI